MKHWLLALGLTCTIILSPAAPLRADDRRETPEVLAVKRASPAVVNIHTEKTATDRDSVFATASAPKSRKVNGMGTGVIVDERGYIVTNFHVVSEVDMIRVALHDASSFQANVVRYDRERDLAIIKIETNRSLPVMAVGTSSDLMLAETVFAVGNAYGYEHTITRGIISALGRNVEANETQSYKNLIQTDASINPGNSGGPLINLNGEVVGINVAIRAGAQRIGFAIPIDDVRKTIAQLMSVEQLDRTYHGLAGRDLKTGTSRMLIVDNTQPDSPAAKSGLKPGDVVLKVADKEVVDNADFERSLIGRRAGESVTVLVRRGETTESLQLALAPLQTGRSRMPNTEIVARANNDMSDADRFWKVLGVKLTTVSQDRARTIPTKYRGGLVVTAVRPESPADKNGIRKDDILVGLWGWETLNFDNMNWILSHPDQANTLAGTAEEKADPYRYYVIRGQQTLFGRIQLLAADASTTITK